MNGVITINRDYQLWELCDDGSRPVLSGICFEPEGAALGSNGFIAGVVRYKFEADGEQETGPCVIPGAWLKAAFKASPRYGDDVRIIVDEEFAYTFDKSSRTALIKGTFPNFRQLFPKDLGDGSPTTSHMTLDTVYATALAKALNIPGGRKGSWTVPMYYRGPEDVIAVLPTHGQAVGLIMPIMIKAMEPAKALEQIEYVLSGFKVAVTA